MSRGKKLAIAALVTLALIVAIIAIIVPRLVNFDRYRPEVIASIAHGTGRSVEIGRLSLSVLPVIAVRADKIAIGNPPGFPEGHLLEIERVDAELDARALLHRQVIVRSLEFDDPKVNLVSTSDGRWNTEAPAGVQPRPALGTPQRKFGNLQPAVWRTKLTAWTPPGTAASQIIGSVRFEHGRVTASNALPNGAIESPEFEADDVTVDLNDVNPAALGLNLAPPTLGSGRFAAPLLAAALFRMPRSQAGGNTGAALPPGAPSPSTLVSGTMAAHGTFSAQSAQFNGAQAASLKSQVELYSGGLILHQFSMELAGGQVTGDFAWDSAARPARYALETKLAGVDLKRLLAGVPAASDKITGTLEGELRMSGLNLASSDSLSNKEGQGQLTIRNGTLPTLQLNRNLMELLKTILKTSADRGDPSSFQSITADVEISGGAIQSRQITIIGNGIDVDASGSLALAGEGRLDYQGAAKIDARRNGFEGIVAGLLGSKVSTDGKIDVPFTITGTLDRPRFALKHSPLFH